MFCFPTVFFVIVVVVVVVVVGGSVFIVWFLYVGCDHTTQWAGLFPEP